MTQQPPADFPFPTADKHDAPDPSIKPVDQDPSEDAIDQGVEESFPASDPVSVSVTKIERTEVDKSGDGGKTRST